MTLSEELAWRGLIKDYSFSDYKWLDSPKRFYLGIDPSADSLTVGNLAILLLALRLAKAGWGAYLVMGGGTSLVGDPGGKTEERQLMSRQTIEHNIAGVREQVRRVFHGQAFKMVDNYDWLAGLKYLDFIRDVGKHFSMTELMQRDFVAERMGEGAAGISYTEFSYSLVQGYDFWHLFKSEQVVMQIGGSDQWGNMLSGVSLIRKKENQEAVALSMPLIINRLTGKKFGKSEEGAVWLDPAKTSGYKFYQFWLNLDDEGVEDYLKIYTELDKTAIEETMQQFNKDKAGRQAQKTLAYEVTALVHGKERASEAKRATAVLFGDEQADGLSKKEWEMLKAELPHESSRGSDSLADSLVRTGLAASKSDANRLLASGAISINGKKVTADYSPGMKKGPNLVRRGKNSFAVVEVH